jgi:predicted dehydrogenase
MVGKGDKWEHVPFEDPPAEMTNEWQAFAEAIALDLEPATPGEYGRHIMEILLAAEESAVSGREVVLGSGQQWTHQETGSPVTGQHGWV